MDSIKELNLTDLLTVDLTEEPIKFFINPSGMLETFYNYKAHLIDVVKLNLKVQLGQMSQEQVESHLIQVFANSIQKALPLVINYEKASNFEANTFFSNLKFITPDFWKRKNILDVNFLRKAGIVNKSNDKDLFGNPGFYKADNNFTIAFLSTCAIEDINEIKANLPEGLDVEFIHIK
jgi:hypothetical protein